MNNTTNTNSAKRTSKTVANATNSVKPLRDAHGRFLPKSEGARTVVRKNASVNDVVIGHQIAVNNSEWINSIVFNEDNTVGLVMKKYPNTIYAYKPTAKGLRSVLSAVRNGASLGSSFNKHLRDREIYRVVFKA
jgi:hypothetical protein